MSSECESGVQQYYKLADVPTIFELPTRALRLLLLADDKHPANVVKDHIHSFREYSKHRITVVNTRHVVRPELNYMSNFDVLLIHYSIFVLAETYLSTAWQESIADFRGVVAVIHEDEYQQINAFKQKFAELGVRAVFSCLDSAETMRRVYAGEVMPRDTLFFSCLPGYITSHLLGIQSPPIHARRLDIVYRGRNLPPELGRFAQEKRIIGEQMQAIADANGLRSDISSIEEDRIYGQQWPLFLMSAKATLGVEGGASIFDFDGTVSSAVAAYKSAHPAALFEEIWGKVLAEHEGNIEFRTITPKFFEIIAARTALVLYPGNYSNVLVADRHYIPLERDGANVADVVAKLKDDKYLQEIVDRTRKEVLCRPEFSSQFYVNQIDRVLWGLSHQAPLNWAAHSTYAAASSLEERNQMMRLLANTQLDLLRTHRELRSTKQDLSSFRRGSIQAQRNLLLAEQELAVARAATAQISADLLQLRTILRSPLALFKIILRTLFADRRMFKGMFK